MVKDNHFTDEFKIKGLPPLPKGKAKVKVEVAINTNLLMTVKAECLQNGVSESLRIDYRQKQLSKAEILAKLLEKEKENYNEEEVEFVKSKGSLQYLMDLINVQFQINKLFNEIPEPEQKKLKEKLQKTEVWIKSPQLKIAESFMDKMDEINDLWRPIKKSFLD